VTVVRPDPLDYGWWLASRASGVVALALLAASVGLGLAMAARALRRPGLPRILLALHEHLALAALVAVAVHGITLLGDRWLHPGPAGIAVPFVMGYRPLWTGLGIVAGYLGAALGLSFYLRRRLGAKRWRATHRLTPLVYVLALAHTLGAGTDAGTPWLRGLLVVLSAPLVHLGVLRALPAPGRDSHRKRPTSDRGRAVARAAGQPREASVSPPRRSPA
jgi:methionine sulfoxide reductase heme-binding subunit